MSFGTRLRIYAAAALLLTASFAGWTISPEQNFSDGMKRRAHVGLPHWFSRVPIAVELARTPKNFRAIFEGPGHTASDASAGDRENVNTGLNLDYGLVVSYTALMIVLGLRTWLPGYSGAVPLRLVLVILPLLVGACDALENLGAQFSLNEYSDLSPATVRWTAIASWSKWILGFLELVLLGWSMLAFSRSKGPGSFLREFAGLILLAAGVVGLFGILFPSVIPGAFAVSFLALPLIGLMVFVPDEWASSVKVPPPVSSAPLSPISGFRPPV